MKLRTIEKALPPQHVHLTMAGELFENVKLYADYNSGSQGQKLLIPDLINTMLTMFLESDRDFLRYLKEKGLHLRTPSVAIAREKPQSSPTAPGIVRRGRPPMKNGHAPKEQGTEETPLQ